MKERYSSDSRTQSPRGWFSLELPFIEAKTKKAAGSEKSSEIIVRLMKEKPSISAQELAGEIGISSRAVEKHIASLQNQGIIKRTGPPKGGRWEVFRDV